MSGHSKWSTIKRKKGAEDAKRGKIFTRLSRDIMLAARSGGGDQDANPSLRLAVSRAKAANMPKDNIERAIKKGTGELEGGNVEEITYEAYAPHGIPLLIQCVTDNRNRTLAELRRIFNRQGGNMAEAGAVSWMFDTKGYITIERTDQDPDDIFMFAVDAGADDVEIGDEVFEIYTSSDELHTVRGALEDNGLKIDEAQLSRIPKNEIELGKKETEQILNLIELLDDIDDVDQVYSGLAVSDSLLAELAG
ncbi:YebC/PmpR family DNA-binding transcriptional regulator [Anaerolineales bacterium HSG24]|nr:YebC/PmpR family DNA-binding transcriptional regulator [Anaerolineales bacterium HSG24]